MRKHMYLLMILILSLSLMVGCADKDDNKKNIDEVTPTTTQNTTADAAAEEPADETTTPAAEPAEEPAESAAEAAETTAAEATEQAEATTAEETSAEKESEPADAETGATTEAADKDEKEDRTVFMSFDISGKGEMTLTIENNGHSDITTGQDFVMEKKVGPAWVEVNLDLSFPKDDVVIGPNENHEFKYQLPEDFHFEIHSTYRVVKHVSQDDGEDLKLVASFDAE